MPEPAPIWEFSGSTPPILFWAAVAILGMLGVAVAIELHRRFRQRRDLLAAEWEHVRLIASEKELNAEDFALLEELIRGHASGKPLQTVTTRRAFDAVVDAHMAEIETTADAEAVTSRGARLRDLRVRLGLDYVPLGRRIDSTRDLAAGQQAWIAPPGEVGPKWYHVQLTAVDEATFTAASREEGAAPPFRAGDAVRVRLWREDDARYLFTTEVLDAETRPPRYRFRHATELKRVQARAHFRIRVDQDTVIGVLAGSGEDDAERLGRLPLQGKLRGRITNLSGGGCAIVTNEAAPAGRLLRFPVELAEEDPADVFARIVEIAPLSGARSLLRVVFIGIDEECRDAITRYVFKRQQAMQAAEGRAPESRE